MNDRKKPANALPLGRAAERLARREVDYGAEDRLLPLDAVIQIAGVGKTMIYRKMREGAFPKACKPFGSSSSRWSEREIKAWLEEQRAMRRAA